MDLLISRSHCISVYLYGRKKSFHPIWVFYYNLYYGSNWIWNANWKHRENWTFCTRHPSRYWKNTNCPLNLGYSKGLILRFILILEPIQSIKILYLWILITGNACPNGTWTTLRVILTLAEAIIYIWGCFSLRYLIPMGEYVN